MLLTIESILSSLELDMGRHRYSWGVERLSIDGRLLSHLIGKAVEITGSRWSFVFNYNLRSTALILILNLLQKGVFGLDFLFSSFDLLHSLLLIELIVVLADFGDLSQSKLSGDLLLMQILRLQERLIRVGGKI